MWRVTCDTDTMIIRHFISFLYTVPCTQQTLLGFLVSDFARGGGPEWVTLCRKDRHSFNVPCWSWALISSLFLLSLTEPRFKPRFSTSDIGVSSLTISISWAVDSPLQSPVWLSLVSCIHIHSQHKNNKWNVFTSKRVIDCKWQFLTM